MSTPAELRALLARHGLAAHRGLGQNFLADDRLAEKLVVRAGVEAGDSVLEIGTGLGILTRALARAAARVITVEIDAGLVRVLRDERVLPANAELVHGDALLLDLAALLRGARGPARVVANLPYAAAAPLLRRLLDLRGAFVSAAVMLQREFAERVAAEPGSPDYGSLAVLHAWTVRVERSLDIHPRCFHPVPRVFSRFLVLTPHGDPRLATGELERLEPLLRAGFGHRRKTLANALRAAGPGLAAVSAHAPAVLAELGMDARVRAEQIDPETWLRLARCLRAAAAGV